MNVTLPRISYAAWTEWRPEAYLAEYYAELMPDERFALEFLVEAAARLPEVEIALDFGCGPTVHHLFPLVPKVREIHLAEYLADNRAEVSKWVHDEDDCFNWRAFTLETLRLEGDTTPSCGQAWNREEETRSRITAVLPGDAGVTDPLGPEKRGFYPLVTSHYCAEGATNSQEMWALYMRNITSLVKSGGTLILSACGAADFYTVGALRFPCAGITDDAILGCLEENGFRDIDLRVRQVGDHSSQGYSSVIFASAIKA